MYSQFDVGPLLYLCSFVLLHLTSIEQTSLYVHLVWMEPINFHVKANDVEKYVHVYVPVLCILSSMWCLCFTSPVHLMYTSSVPCCSSHLIWFCLSSTSCSFPALLGSSSLPLASTWGHYKISRCPKKADYCPSFVPLSLNEITHIWPKSHIVIEFP